MAPNYTPQGNADSLQMHAFNPYKTIYVRFKEDGKNIVLGPQTGPLRGWTGYTESGYPLDKNVKDADIVKIERK